MDRRDRTRERLNDLLYLTGLTTAAVTTLGGPALFYYAYNAAEPVTPLVVLIVWLCLAFFIGLIVPHRPALVLAVLPWPIGFGLSRLADATVPGFLGNAWYAEGTLSIALSLLCVWLGTWLHRFLATLPVR